MEILLWLVPAAVTTALAIGYVSWVGRTRADREPTKADQERFAAAILKPLPQQARQSQQTLADRESGPDTRRAS